MLNRFVDELVLDVLRDVLQELNVATVKQFSQTLLHSLDIIWLTLQLSALLIKNTEGSVNVGGEKLPPLPLRGSVASCSPGSRSS